MTEQEWLACADPTPMLEFLRRKVSDRKLRLFAVACCRRISHLFSDKCCDRGVETAEQFAEGIVGVQELYSAFEAVHTSLSRKHYANAAAFDATIPKESRSFTTSAQRTAENACIEMAEATGRETMFYRETRGYQQIVLLSSP